MIEAEKQPDNRSNQTDPVSVTSEESVIGTSIPAEVELSVDNPSFSQSQTNEASATVVSGQVQGENRAAVATEDTTSTQGVELSDSATGEGLRQELETLKAQLEESTKQCDSFKNQYMRIAADFENFRKRTAKEKEELELQVKCTTISELLSVVDNFERARSQIKPQTDGEMTIHKSYQSVYKQLVDGLKRLGVSPMRPEGKEFDPNLHEAVMRQPSEEYPEGVVLEELVRGYFLGDRILRHAMVKVAAPAEPVITSEENHPASPES